MMGSRNYLCTQDRCSPGAHSSILSGDCHPYFCLRSSTFISVNFFIFLLHRILPILPSAFCLSPSSILPLTVVISWVLQFCSALCLPPRPIHLHGFCHITSEFQHINPTVLRKKKSTVKCVGILIWKSTSALFHIEKK